MIANSDPSKVQPSDKVASWLSALERVNNAEGMEKYDKRCKLIRRRFRYESAAFTSSRHYQLLWSNIETLKGVVYSRPPKTVVSRRNRDADPVARVASEILERAINFTFDASDFEGAFKHVRDDFLLYGRGCARIFYEPEYETKEDVDDGIERTQGTDLEHGAAGDGGPAYHDVGEYRGGSRGGVAGAVRAGRDEPQGAHDQAIQRGEGAGQRDKGAAEGLKFEKVRIRFVHRTDLRHPPARVWDEVPWVAFRAFMSRDELVERFGKKVGKNIGLDSTGLRDEDDASSHGERTSKDEAKATVWEIWDKNNNKVLWVAKAYPEVLEEGPPYLILDGFYPCPRPAYGTLTTDSLIPVPDYIFYQDQCEEIDQLTARIGALSDALKLVGFYPAGPQGEGVPEIEKALEPGFENKMIAVQAWDAFVQGGTGIRVAFLPVEQVSSILQTCIALRKQLVEDVYQIIGISDIMRGATDPQETEGAQHLKAQFGGNRIRDRQQEIARFCRDIGRLCGQVLSTYCSPSSIEKMTNINLPSREAVALASMSAAMTGQVPNGQAPNGEMPNGQAQFQPNQPTEEDVFGLLQDNVTRRFKIEIESESTIAGDEHQEREDRTAFIQALTLYMEAWGPMVMHKPELAPLAGQLLLFGIRAFRIGRELEETVEELSEKMQAAAKIPQEQPPDPRVQAETIKLQGTQAKVQADIQKSAIAGEMAKTSAQVKLQEAQLDGQTKIAELRMKLAQAEQEHHHKTVEAGLEHSAMLEKMALERQKLETQKQAASAKMPDWPKGQKGF